ncbi:MAG: ComF family protein [Hyphomicrobiales bacterium]|nr:ComF family protein [Hyphomicrobiales bacterium]
MMAPDEAMARSTWLGKVFAGLPKRAADLILPPACPACRVASGSGAALCADCWASVRFLAPPLCPVLGTPFSHDVGTGIVSAAVLAEPPPFARARSAVVYEDTARRLVHALKYRDRHEVAGFMARAMIRAGRELLADCALIVPVPLHPQRLWLRRFNQAALLSDRIGRESGIGVQPMVLKRIRRTRQQVGLSARERDANVRGAFRVSMPEKTVIAGRRVLLVDDVYTSGATARAASRALLRGGAAAVDVLTFARVVH